MTRNRIALVSGAGNGVRLATTPADRRWGFEATVFGPGRVIDTMLSLLRRSEAAANLLTVRYAGAFSADRGLAHVEEAGQSGGFLDDPARVPRVRS